MGVQHVSESDVESVKMSKLKDNNCDLCDISYVTREELTEHYWSLMHHIKLEQRKKDSVHYCTICYASCENLTEYSKHLNGDQHRKALLEERKAKLRESDGSNSNVQTDDLDHAGTDDRSRPRSRTSNSTISDYAYSRTGGSTERSHPYSGGSSYRNRSFESQNQAATNDKHYHHHHHHRSYSNRSQNSQIDENYQHHRSSSHRPQQNNPKRGFNNKKRGRGNRREGNTWHRYNRWTYHTTGRDAPNDLYDGYYKDCNKQRQYWNNDDYPIDGESFTSDTTEFIHGFDNHLVGDEVIPQHRDHSTSKSQEMMVDSVAVCQPETQQIVPRSRSRSPLKMKIPSLLDAPVKLASGYASVKWPIGYDVSTTEIDETPREDCGKTLLDKAENLCKTLREKREQAKADREKREKQDEKRQQHDELDKKIQDYSDVCQSKIKGILNETMDTTDLGSVTTLNETTSIRLPTSKENLTSLNQSTATETSSVSSTSTTVGKTSTRKHPVKSVDSAKVNFVKQNAEPMNKTQLMKMINAPRSLKERRHLEKILVNRPKKSSRPKLNLQPQVEECQPVENVDVEELPDELRLKVEKLCDVEPLDCDSDTLLAQCSDLIDSNRYGGSALSESQSKRRHSLTSPPVSSFSMDTLNKKKRTGSSSRMDISMEISRSPSTPSTVVDTGCGESVISVKQEPVWVTHSTIPAKMPETILPADVSSNVINQQPPVTCTSVNENPDTVQNSPISQMPQIASNIMANHPTFSELSVLNKATSVLTMSGNNRGNLDLQHIDPPTAMNTSQDSNQSMSQVLQITLREEQIRNNLNVIHSHVDRCKTLLRETQKEIEYFTNLHEFLIKEEVNLRQQRLNILKGAVGNASTSSIQTPILISSPQTNRAIHDDSITSQSANNNTLPSAESNNNNKNVTMEYVGTLQSQVAAEKLLHELSSNSQEIKSSTPQPGVFAVPEPVLSDINTDTDLNRDSTYLKPKKKQTSVRSKSTDSSMTDESSASTSSSTITKKKQSKKKSDKKKLEKNMKLQKKKKSKKAAKMNNDDDNVDISFLYQSSSATDTDSTVQEKADSEKRADDSSDISRGGESRSNADIPPDMALEILSDKRSHKEKFKAILLDSVDTTMQISNTWEDPDCIFLDKISPYQMETDTSALNTPTSVMSSQLSSVGNSSRYPVVVLNRIDEASKQEKIAQFKDDLLQIPDSSPNTTKKKRTKKKKKIPTDSNMGSTSSLADSSTESFNDISRHDSRNAGNLKVSRDLLVEAGVIFTNSDAEQMLSDSTVIKSEDDDHSIVSSSNLTEKNSLQLDLSTPKSATKVIRSVKESYSSLATPGEFLGHSMPIFCMQVSGGFLYSCSQDASIRKYDLKTHACVLKFSGHTKAVHCLSVTSSPEDLLFTGGFDNMLIIHSSKTGTILDKFEMDSKLHCMHSAWGKLYIGLEDGCVHCFDFKSNSVIDTFRCSDRPISAITSTREGIRRLLLVGSYDTLITVRDANSWLLLRTIEAHDKTPLSIRVYGSQIFSTSNDYTVKVHDLYTAGHVYTFPKFPGAMTSLAVHKDVILAAGFDGLIRCYDIKTFQLLGLYYGAGKTLILDMLVYNNMIFTANRHGVIEAISFNPKVVFPCNVIGCKLKFGLTCDLLYHVTEAHLPATSTSTGVKCPWNGCYLMLILGSNAREHIAHHIEDLDDDSLSNLSS